jgi:hypothetical protein
VTCKKCQSDRVMADGPLRGVCNDCGYAWDNRPIGGLSDMEFQWRNLAQAYYERYVETLAANGRIIEGKFDDLSQEEINAIIEGVKYTCHLFGSACLA